MRAWRFLDWTGRAAHVTAQFQLEPHDLWVGVFWQYHKGIPGHTGWDRHHGDFSAVPWSMHLYICILPLLPLHVYIMRTERP